MFLKKRFPLPAVVLNPHLMTSGSQALGWGKWSEWSLKWIHRRAEAGALRASCHESVIIWTDERVDKPTDNGGSADTQSSACRSAEDFSSSRDREFRLPTCSLSGRSRFLRVARFRWTCLRHGRLTAPLPAACPGKPLFTTYTCALLYMRQLSYFVAE